MTNEELGWKVIKDMNISGPWQEHIVHHAIMKALELKEHAGTSQWLDINDTKPDDGQRVLTWNNKFCESRIQVYNEECQCWDTEDGDDIEFTLDATTKSGNPIIQYWQPLPKRPHENK